MEAVYFYETAKEKDVKNILGTDKFMRISFETKIGGHNEKTGYHIYVIGSQEELSTLGDEFKALGLDKPTEINTELIIKKFKVDAENAACGMGLIFG